MVHDKKAENDSSRWDNVSLANVAGLHDNGTHFDQIIFSTTDLWDESKWTEAVHVPFNGYDISPHWDDEGNSYIVGSHAWKVA